MEGLRLVGERTAARTDALAHRGEGAGPEQCRLARDRNAGGLGEHQREQRPVADL
jgi:hypothetical protein